MSQPSICKKAGFDPDNPQFPTLHKAALPWHDAGFPFVVACRRTLEQTPEAMGAVLRLGLDAQNASGAWLGLNPQEAVFKRSDWGLEPKVDAAGKELPLVIPAGLILPHFDGAHLDRIRVRPGLDPEEYASMLWTHDRELLVDGSDAAPLFLELEPGECVACVPDELGARFLEQEAGDCVNVLALPGPDTAPGKESQGSPGCGSGGLCAPECKRRRGQDLGQSLEQRRCKVQNRRPAQRSHAL